MNTELLVRLVSKLENNLSDDQLAQIVKLQDSNFEELVTNLLNEDLYILKEDIDYDSVNEHLDSYDKEQIAEAYLDRADADSIVKLIHENCSPEVVNEIKINLTGVDITTQTIFDQYKLDECMKLYNNLTLSQLEEITKQHTPNAY